MYDTTKPSNAIVKEQMKRTWENNRWLSVVDGTYPMFRRKVDLLQWDMDHTDGIGTKGVFHWKYRTFRNAVLDAMAMNLNDMLMARARPYKIQNHITLPEDDLDAVAAIATALADECIPRSIVMTGGETSVHDTADGMDLSVTMSGFIVDRYTNKFSPGSVLVGLASSGLHCNGFTLARKTNLFRDSWLTPTRVYDIPDRPFSIEGIQHITGGAFTKIRSKMGKDANVVIHNRHGLVPQDDFKAIHRALTGQSSELAGGDADTTMYRTFNCGIGMVLSVYEKDVSNILAQTGGEVIGEVRPGDGKIVIESMFSGKSVNL